MMQNILRDMKKADMLWYLLFAPLCIMASTFFAMSLQPVIDAGLSGGSVRFCPRLCLGGCAGPCGCAGRLSGKCAEAEDQNGMYQTTALSIFQQLLPAACSAVSENRQHRAALEAHRGRGSCSRLTQRRCVRFLRRRGPPFCRQFGGQTALCWITYPLPTGRVRRF